MRLVQMVKHDKIEVRCSPELRTEFEKFSAEVSGELRKILKRRVYNEDVIWYILEVYKQNPQIFKSSRVGPQVK